MVGDETVPVFLYAKTQTVDPQSTFFNNVFTTYLCMRGMSRTAIEDKP